MSNENLFRELLRQGKLDEAHRALIEIAPSNNDSKSLPDLLDAWVNHQKDLLRNYDKRNRSGLHSICHAADMAHEVLLKIEPRLSQSTFGDDRLESTTLQEKCNAVLECWADASFAGFGLDSRKTRNIPQRARYLLSCIAPTLESYKYVLKAWAYSNEHLRGYMAQSIFDELCRKMEPDVEAYRLIIAAWSLSKERRAAFSATGHLMKMVRLLEQGDRSMAPLLADYKLALSAWTNAEDKASPGKAVSVIKLMEKMYKQELSDIQPDIECYRYVLQTISQRPNTSDLGVLVDGILSRMKERMIIPDSGCYAAAIRTWKYCAFNSESSQNREESIGRCFQLLSESYEAEQRSSQVSSAITIDQVNDTIEALSVSLDPQKCDRASSLLGTLEKAFDGNTGEPTPNAESYQLVLEVLRRSEDREKIDKAEAILLRFKRYYDKITPDDDRTNIVNIFNTFVKVCGSSTVENERIAIDVLRIAINAVESMRTLDPSLMPNSSTFVVLLEICKKLPWGRDRQFLVKKIFQLCCKNGMVDDAVLSELRSATNSEQYMDLVISKSIDLDGIKTVPEAWTVNALGSSVVTAEGRKTKPLSIDGQVAVTKAMRDFQMRRLRDKRNRNLLRGGRLAKQT